MRAMVARLRGPWLTPGERVDAALSDIPPYCPGPSNAVASRLTHREFCSPAIADDPGAVHDIEALAAGYLDALVEARQMCQNLGLDIGVGSEASAFDVSGLVRYTFAQGWLACESRLASPNMADAIDLAITTPAAVVAKNQGESDHRWTIRAIQQTVAHDTKAEPR